MQTKHLFLLPALAFFACAGLQAQVRIGDATAPTAGAILDLNSTAKGGLLLSNVALTSIGTIPESFPGVTSANYKMPEVKNSFTGAIVYHTGENNIPAGVYVWDGDWWTIDSSTPATIKDAQNQEYSIAKFGDAGWWMTQNLRTTNYAYVDETQTPLVKKTAAMTSGSATEPRYTFPGTGDATERENALSPEQLEAYGLLYNWVAASGRSTADDSNNSPGYGSNAPTPGQYYRGVCPENWHLPSDYEWSELEKEIATNPGKYSSQETAYTFTNSDTYDNLYTPIGIWRPGDENEQLDTYWGRQMKSTTIDTNSSSKKREDGGFDALPTGVVYSSGTANGYGSSAHFWSSSSYSSLGVRRLLLSGYTGVGRNYYDRGYLFSVRCKKD
jgi:uncharacterized protein (TIGR02145 family)